MIYLNDRDIRRAVSLEDIMESVEEGYRIYEENEFNQPDRINITEKKIRLCLCPL